MSVMFTPPCYCYCCPAQVKELKHQLHGSECSDTADDISEALTPRWSTMSIPSLDRLPTEMSEAERDKLTRKHAEDVDKLKQEHAAGRHVLVTQPWGPPSAYSIIVRGVGYVMGIGKFTGHFT